MLSLLPTPASVLLSFGLGIYLGQDVPHCGDLCTDQKFRCLGRKELQDYTGIQA